MNYATTKEMVSLLGDESIENSFTLCCKMGLTDMVRMMLEKGADPTISNFNAFRFASEQGHDEVLELLIKSVSVSDFKKELKECHALAMEYDRKYCILLLNKTLQRC
jgi:ankyrin repeat protein